MLFWTLPLGFKTCSNWPAFQGSHAAGRARCQPKIILEGDGEY